jgi:hypothetical protein
MSRCDLSRASLHNTQTSGTVLTDATMVDTKRDDVPRLEAEAWQPPQRT